MIIISSVSMEPLFTFGSALALYLYWLVVAHTFNPSTQEVMKTPAYAFFCAGKTWPPCLLGMCRITELQGHTIIPLWQLRILKNGNVQFTKI